MAYPDLIRLLMDRTYRDEQLKSVEPEAAGRQRARRRHLARVHAQRDRHHHARRPGAPARAAGQGSSRRRRRRGRHGLRAVTRRLVADVRDAAIRRQGRHARRRRRTAASSAGRPPAPRAARLRHGRAARPANVTSTSIRYRVSSRTIRSAGLRDAPSRSLILSALTWRSAASSSTTLSPRRSPCAAARVVITAKNERWAREAALKLTGFATSVIACKCEAAIERSSPPAETPDGRPGVSVLLFTMDTDSLGKRLIERIGQTVLTCPTTSCFDGLPDSPDRA